MGRRLEEKSVCLMTNGCHYFGIVLVAGKGWRAVHFQFNGMADLRTSTQIQLRTNATCFNTIWRKTFVQSYVPVWRKQLKAFFFFLNDSVWRLVNQCGSRRDSILPLSMYLLAKLLSLSQTFFFYQYPLKYYPLLL